MQTEDSARRKFDLFIEYLRKNKSYETHCRRKRKHKPFGLLAAIPFDPFTMTNDELWDLLYQYKSTGIDKYDPSEIDFDKFVLSKILQREPTTQELIDHLKEKFSYGCYIRVTNLNLPLTTLTKGFKKIVEEEKKKSPDAPEEDKAVIANYRIKELERYLAVYDARETIENGKKMKWIRVWQQLNPKKDFGEFNEDARLSLLRDYRKACELISKSFM